MIDRSFIGKETAPVVYDVEKGHIARFADALGDPDPIYRDEEAARAAGFAAIPAPPTFPTALRGENIRDGMGIPWSRILHGEQSYRFTRPLLAGDRVAVVHRVAGIRTKEGRSGTMEFLTTETEGRDAETGEVIYTGRCVVIVKGE